MNNIVFLKFYIIDAYFIMCIKFESFKQDGTFFGRISPSTSSRKTPSSVFLVILITILISTILPNPPLHASDQKRGPKGLIRVGIFPFAPFNYMDENEIAQGLNPDLLREIVRDEQWRVAFIPGSWSEGLDRLQNGEIDLIMSVAYSKKRSEVMDFNFESVAELWGQVFYRLDKKIANIGDLEGQSVAVMQKDINGSNFIKTTERLGIKPTIKEFVTHHDVFAAIQSGEVIAGVAPQHFGLGHAEEYGLAASSIIFSPFSIYFSSQKGKHHELLSHIDAHLTEWKQDNNSFYYKKLNNWLGSQIANPVLPKWIIYTLSFCAFFILFFAGFTFILNKTVRSRTRDLQESETRFKDVTLNISDLVWELDEHGTFQYCSEQVFDILGYTPEEMIGTVNFYFMPEYQINAAKIFFSKLVQSHRPFRNYENWNIHKNGRHVCLSTSGVPVLRKDGVLLGFRGTATDITDKKAAKQVVETNQLRLQSLIEIAAKEEPSESELIDFILEKGVQLTNSLAGYFHYQNSVEQKNELTSVSKPVDRDYTTETQNCDGMLNSSLWTDSLRTREPAIHNDFQDELEQNDLLKGPLNIKRHMSVPVIIDDKIVAIAGVTNKLSPYTSNDCDQLTLLFTDALHIIEKRKTERALAESEKRLRHIVEATFEGYCLSTDGKILDTNTQFTEIFGYSQKELIGSRILDLIAPESQKIVQENGRNNFGDPYEVTALRKNGTPFPIVVQGSIIQYKGAPVREAIVRDLSQQRELEAKLRQSYKMEAIGTLAGGIAHDFNNLLSIIIGYTEMAQEDASDNAKCQNNLNQALGAAAKAIDLVSQILAFSRQTDVEKIPLNPSTLIFEWLSMLRSSLPTTITIDQDIDRHCGVILADATQLQQIFMNLCTNAFHAMEEKGGTLTVVLKKHHRQRSGPIRRTATPETGKYIELSISDIGHGINPADLDKIFDPYFTTKEQGKGTGMGLAVIHSIVEDYGGMINVDSIESTGTTFQVLLPTIEEAILHERKQANEIPGGTERILFVDDEPGLVAIGKTMLGKLGYQVTPMSDSVLALELFRKKPSDFDLVITDQTMPGITGAELAVELLKINRNLPIILCTGFSSIISEEKAHSIGIREFAIKPLKKRDIAHLVRRTLDGTS